ncbi:MAG: hypothetical protein EZS28_006255 [Streblomastix strix]|uniref:Cyclin N-terminal domain-containing protein n=1 Tax=Streblomastix strix TaxID=222440 RepID=A0A5J4WTB8_9EUKA|nr:MAG: hypothetical protein EZS28_006255 [Streblomastix strix]
MDTIDSSTIQEAKSQDQLLQFADSCHIETQIKTCNGRNKQQQQMIAQKLVQIIYDAVPGADKFITIPQFEQFLQQLQQKAELHVEEAMRAVMLLQRFIAKQQKKNVRVIKVSNFGTLIIVSFILAMKLSQEKTHNNQFFAEMFGIPLAHLNRSEISFLRIIDFELWVDIETLITQ